MVLLSSSSASNVAPTGFEAPSFFVFYTVLLESKLSDFFLLALAFLSFFLVYLKLAPVACIP